MLLEAVDNFLPGWTREGYVALRSIRLRHTQFLISVTLLEDEEEVGAFYLSRSSTGTSPPTILLRFELTCALHRSAIFLYRRDEKQDSSSTFANY